MERNCWQDVETRCLNWSEILKKGGIAEPPGYLETLALLKKRGPRMSKAQRKKAKPKRKR